MVILSLTGQRDSTISNHFAKVSIDASVSGTKFNCMLLKPARSLFEAPKKRSGLISPETLIFNLSILNPNSLATICPTTLIHPAKPAKIYSTGFAS